MLKYVGILLVSLCLIGTLSADSLGTEITLDDSSDDSTTKVEPTKMTTEASTQTLPPSIETTTPVPTTTQETTVVPVTTTSAHETTTPESVTTTPESVTTTPESVTTTPESITTTPEPVTTSSTVAPTALPTPEAGHWEVQNKTDTNITCIRTKMAVQFKVFYNGIEIEHNLSPNATSDKSSCIPVENDTQVLILEDHGYALTFIFSKDSSSVYVRNMSLVIPNVPLGFETSEKQFEVKIDKSYLCNSKSIIKMGNATLEFLNVHLQAFMRTQKDFSLAEDCAADDKMSDIVPISVAVALCLMVVIILVGYLVTRRQSRQRGYQSV